MALARACAVALSSDRRRPLPRMAALPRVGNRTAGLLDPGPNVCEGGRMTVPLRVHLPPHVRSALEAHAAASGLSLSALVSELVAALGPPPRLDRAALRAAQNEARASAQRGVRRAPTNRDPGA